MAHTLTQIGAAVGIRDGQSMMPNTTSDLNAITDLLDRIPVSKGGSAEIGGVWSKERTALIDEVTAQIVTFQTTNNLPKVDGVIDRGGRTLHLMNQLASEPLPGTITATVVDAPGKEEQGPIGVWVVDVNQMTGLKPFQPMPVSADYVRKLVRVDNCSIKWFGVVIPRDCTGISSIPHINFTPTPAQGGYYDVTYDSFGGWGQLWEDYTSVIGGQMTAAGVEEILVIPFYKNSQTQDLGNFMSTWKEVVVAVVTAALDSFNPYLLRKSYEFDKIVSSSFSNGYVAHMTFNLKADGAAAATNLVIDLDGQAGGSTWTPPNGVIYRNKAVPGNVNPMGNVWYVGGRWGAKFPSLYGGSLNTHAASRNHLLYHGLFMFG
jgi:hypothetical protein